MAENKFPFFAASGSGSQKKEEKSVEEEIEELTQAEMDKLKRASKYRNANGVDYAPWMQISEEDEKQIRQVMREKAEARRKRQMQEKSVSGNLLVDSQAQELSGTGLRAKLIDEDVELLWATNSEKNTKGYIVKRRPAKTEDFEVIASFKNWGPLASKGPNGGEYRYLDTSVPPGGWVYRVTECDNFGTENDLCQALVEVQTSEEKVGTLVATVAIVALVGAAVAAGILLDPVGGFQ